MPSSPKPFVFVLMPFREEYDDVYNLGIKPACEKAGAIVERLDDQIFTENMLQRIYSQIAEADILVADLSEQNPNVFYELGYAHALQKPVILLTKRSGDIPFDLKHYPHIVYKGRITDLLWQLEKRVRGLINQKSDMKIGPSNKFGEIIKLVEEAKITHFESLTDLENLLNQISISYEEEDKIALESSKKFKDNKILTLHIHSSGDSARDMLRIRRLYGMLISYPGDDRFTFYLTENKRGHLLEFPEESTGITDELTSRLGDIVGVENMRVEQIIYE